MQRPYANAFFPAVSGFPAGGNVVCPQWLVWDSAAELPVKCGDVKIETRCSASERLEDNETGQGLPEHHKSSTTSRSRRRSSGKIA